MGWERNTHGNEKECIQVFDEKARKKKERPLGRHKSRWENNTKMDLRQDGVVRTGFIWLRIGTSG
jgi:hypothetical protein